MLGGRRRRSDTVGCQESHTRPAGSLIAGYRSCIRCRMTKVLTVRIPVDLLGRAEARAHRLGLDRAKYVRQLIEKDIEVAAGEEKSRRRFTSEDLAGSFRLGGHPAINLRVREQLARRALGREKTR